MSTDRPRRPRGGDRLFVIGLVGRAGSGKTTVARALAQDGAVVIEADRVGHEVTDQDPAVRAALTAEYGADVYRADGTLDRARVAARVFASPEARERLDRLVHPRILERIRDRLRELQRADWQGVVVVDAALMLEWGLEREVDALIAVVAPEHEQVTRLRAARGWSEDEARRRLSVQRPNERFAAAADATLESTGTTDALVREAREAVARLLAGTIAAHDRPGEGAC